MIYAQIKDGQVKNTIVLDNEDIEHLFLVGFDDLVRIDELSPEPGIGWAYADGAFEPPAPPPEEAVE